MPTKKIKLKKTKIKAMIIDLGGVIVDCGSLFHSKAIYNSFKLKNIEIENKLINKTNGLKVEEQIKRILFNKKVYNAWQSRYKREPNEDDIKEISNEVNRYILDAIDDDDYIMHKQAKKLNKFYNYKYKIIFTTEYNQEISNKLREKLKKFNFKFNHLLSYDIYKAPSPNPLICYQCAINQEIFPMQCFIRVGDTEYNFLEGLYANLWTVGIVKTSSLLGLSQKNVRDKGIVTTDKIEKKIAKKLSKKGALYTISTLDELKWVIEDANFKLSKGLTPYHL
ncbi:MAG: hypothetical protein SVN78_07540 [Deferribacterota bacterium]|nr:hypothetical protein [Deferribacterota bacterium]